MRWRQKLHRLTPDLSKRQMRQSLTTLRWAATCKSYGGPNLSSLNISDGRDYWTLHLTWTTHHWKTLLMPRVHKTGKSMCAFRLGPWTCPRSQKRRRYRGEPNQTMVWHRHDSVLLWARVQRTQLRTAALRMHKLRPPSPKRCARMPHSILGSNSSPTKNSIITTPD